MSCLYPAYPSQNILWYPPLPKWLLVVLQNSDQRSFPQESLLSPPPHIQLAFPVTVSSSHVLYIHSIYIMYHCMFWVLWLAPATPIGFKIPLDQGWHLWFGQPCTPALRPAFQHPGDAEDTLFLVHIAGSRNLPSQANLCSKPLET